MANAMCLTEFLEDLGSYQPDIRLHREAWDDLPEELFGEPEMRQAFTYVAITAGAFRQFVQAGPDDVDQVLYRCLDDRRFQRFPTFRQVLMFWARPFRKVKQQRPVNREDEEDYAEVEPCPEPARPGKVRRRDHGVFETVNKQKDAIKRLLLEGEVGRAFKYVDDLIQYQRNHSELQDVVRSLCDLAQYAKSVGAHHAQLALAERAVSAVPTDGWSQTQLGDAYLCLSRHEEALKAYGFAIQYGQDAVGRTGRAEVLKALGRLDEALQEYDSTVRDFPQNAVVRTGRAEVLKALGRLDGALQEYDSAVRDFPHEVVAWCGRAEVLRELRRLEEALQEYDRAVRDFPHDVVAWCGRAEVLKELGRLDEALQEYDSTIREFPQDAVARAGRAEVLKALGRLDEALQEYDSTIREFPHNAVARAGRAEVLKALGRLDQALQEYDSTIRDFPQDAVARTGKASLLVLLGRLDEAQAYLPKTTPRTQTDWVAIHIRGMIAMRQGHLDVAITTFQRGIRENPWVADRTYFRSALAVARLRRKEFRQAAEVIAEESAPLCPACDVLRMHAFGALGEISEAQQASDRLTVVRLPTVIVLREELSERYLSQGYARARHSDDWVFDQECRLVLAA